MDYLYVAAWWLGLSLPGWLAFILLRPWLTNLPDRGYAIAKIIGLIGLCYIAWLLANLQVMSFDGIGLWLILVIAAIGAGFAYYRYTIPLADNINRLILAEEGLFAAALVVWSLVRAFNPRAEGVEKLMDATILNGLLRTEWLPPADPWYAGSTINYYYFGHWIVACISKLMDVPAQYAFNLGLAGTFALVALLTFSLVLAVVGSITSGLLAAFLLTLSCNLDPAINAIKQTKNYIFFSATRLDPYTINEFPLYSFVVADLHAHALDLPVAVGITYLLYIICTSENYPAPLVGALALLLGATGPANSFDLVIYGGLTGLVFLFKEWNGNGWTIKSLQRAVFWTLGIGAGSLILYAPFYLHFKPPVGGIGVELFRTPLTFILINFGIFFVLCAPLFVLLPKIYRNWRDRKPVSLSAWFGAGLLTFALLLIIAPEFVYLKDIYTYQNPPFARANTIFKVYYQAWVLLAIAAGIAIGYLRKNRWKRGWEDLFVTVAGVVIGLSLIGTWSGFSTLSGDKPTTINGYAYLATEAPDQLNLINWINSHIDGQPRMLEAAGESYTQRSRVSAYTGLIVPIGWASHEWGWRYSPTEWPEIANRMGDVQTMYTTTDAATLQKLLTKWQIAYIVASPVERQQYPGVDFSLLRQLYGPPVFQSGDYALYQVR